MRHLQTHHSWRLSRGMLCWLLAVAFGFGGADFAYAQYPAWQQAQLLDVKPQIRSGRVNISANRNPRLTYPQWNNLLITGNVTGGRSFQGDIGYRSPYEFQDELGSTSLSDFRRDSVGSGDLTGGLYQSRPFLAPSRGLGQTVGGRIVNTSELIGGAVTPIGSMLRDQPDYSVPFGDTPFAGTATRFNIGPSGVRSGFASNVYDTPPEDVLWSGMPGVPGVTEPSAVNPFALELRRRLQQRIGARLSPAVPGVSGKAEDRGEQEERPIVKKYPPPTNITPFEPSGAYLDFLEQLQLQGEQVNEEQPFGESTIDFARIGAGIADNERGRIKLFREHMKKGGELIDQREYALAAEAFSQAAKFYPSRASANIAKAVALFGAADFSGASLTLDKAFRLSAKVASHKISLRRFFREFTDVRKRLKELGELQDKSPKPALTFLRSYILYQLGLHGQAEAALMKLRRAKPLSQPVKILLEAATAAKKESPRKKIAPTLKPAPKYDDLPWHVEGAD